MIDSYHIPVLLHECIEGLHINPSGVYVDVTFGGGGHSKEILKKLGKDGVLIAFDQDEDAKRNAIKDSRFHFVEHNFRFLKNYCRLLGYDKVDGILADLGVSSHQFDEPSRGFSIRFDSELDMRMDTSGGLTAKDVVNNYSEGELHKIMGMYGEVHNAKTLAKAIAVARLNEPINTIGDLKKVMQAFAPKVKQVQYYAKVFQALRIEVNQELDALQEFLIQSNTILKPGGRLVVMSYHSLEDRLVKNFIAKGKFDGEIEKDFYGNSLSPFESISRGIIIPSAEELATNSRARSAKLRIAQKK